jgi:aryl-alcohol dehydrogenase-like predicted oxidoreductase
MTRPTHLTRREAIRAGLLAGAGLAVARLPLSAQIERAAWQAQLALVTKPIPVSGEQIPVVGVGTNAYSVTAAEDIAARCEVLRTLSENGGKVVDTARQYGRSEEVIGQCVREIGNRDRLFIVTKLSMGDLGGGRGGRGGAGGGGAAGGPAEARAGLELAFSRLQTPMIDVMLVHNLGGPETLLPIMREMKQAGRFRYIGISTSSDGSYAALAQLMEREALDFVQVDYSIGNRSAAERILPIAQDRGIAIMTNVPFGGRRATVLQEVGSTPLPDWAAEINATSWAQVFLKYLVSHPAVTVAIPGTTQARHMIDNLGAARGVLPDAAMRRRIEQYYDSIAA